jgi:hypothetical protein
MTDGWGLLRLVPVSHVGRVKPDRAGHPEAWDSAGCGKSIKKARADIEKLRNLSNRHRLFLFSQGVQYGPHVLRVATEKSFRSKFESEKTDAMLRRVPFVGTH